MLFWDWVMNSHTLTHTPSLIHCTLAANDYAMTWRSGDEVTTFHAHKAHSCVCASRGKNTDIACRHATICWHDKWLFTYPFAFHSYAARSMTLSPAGSSEDILPIVWFESSVFRLELSALIYLSLRAAEFIYCCWKSQVVNDNNKKRTTGIYVSMLSVWYNVISVCESRLFAVCLQSKKQQIAHCAYFPSYRAKRKIYSQWCYCYSDGGQSMNYSPIFSYQNLLKRGRKNLNMNRPIGSASIR